MIEDIFARFSSIQQKRSSQDDNSEKKEIVEDIDPNLEDSDDSELEEEEEEEETKTEYYANAFWKVETNQNIDDLLKEFA